MTVTSIYWRQFSVSKRDRKMEERKFYHRFALGGAACNVLISTAALVGACLVFSFDNYTALCLGSSLFVTAVFAAGNVFFAIEYLNHPNRKNALDFAKNFEFTILMPVMGLGWFFADSFWGRHLYPLAMTGIVSLCHFFVLKPAALRAFPEDETEAAGG